jgi:hypothetical protein
LIGVWRWRVSDINTMIDRLTDRQRQEFAVTCARRVQHLMTDPRSVAALDTRERWLRGEATDEEMAAAQAAARAAARAAASDAAWAASAAASAAAWAASGAASDAASDAARDAAWAASDAASDAARDAAWAAERAWQRAELERMIAEGGERWKVIRQ